MSKVSMVALVLLSSVLLGAAPGDWEGQVKAMSGAVQVKPFGAAWHDAAAGDSLWAGDRLRTGAGGTAVVALPDGSELEVAGGTLFEFNDRRLGDGGGSIALFLGRLWAKVQKAAGKGSAFSVHTATSVAGVRGTAFLAGLGDDGATAIAVKEGAVSVQGEGGRVDLGAGEYTEALHGAAPKPAVKGELGWEAWAEGRRKALAEDPKGPMAAALGKIRAQEKALEAAFERFKALERETAVLIDKARLARAGKQKDAYQTIAEQVEQNFAQLTRAAGEIQAARNTLTTNATAMRHAWHAVAAMKDLPPAVKADLRGLVADLKAERPRLQRLRAEFKTELRQKMGEAHKAYREFREYKGVKEKAKSKRKAKRERE